MSQRLHDLLDRVADEVPHRIAVRTSTTEVDYGQFRAMTVAVGNHLVRAGVTAGDRVVLVAHNGIELAAAVLAPSRIGATFVVVPPSTTAYQLRHVLADCSPRVVVAEPELSALVRNAGWAATVLDLREVCCEPEDAQGGFVPQTRLTDDAPAALIYTSGSTSMPKGVICTHAQMTFAVDAIQERLGLRSDDVVANLLPLSFDYGLYQVLLSMRARATLALGSMSDVGPGVLAQLQRWGATVLPVVPSMLAVLVQLARRSSGPPAALRLITSTGAHVTEALVRDVRAALPNAGLALMFGLTECKRVSILRPEELAAHPGSVGRPLPGTSCEIVDGDGRVVPPGVHGELVVRGPHLAAGYWNAPEPTARKFPETATGGRELRTGDICSMDADGYLYFHGRRDDLYKHHGYRVSGVEVEAAAQDANDVSAAALVHTNSGPTLVVSGDVTAGDVLAHLRERLEDWKLPNRVIAHRDDLPLTANGKLDRAAVLSWVEGR